MKIIYDFGANNGDNIPYYLLKSDLVVAVEANPDLSNNIKKRFEKETINKKLVVLNYVISTERKLAVCVKCTNDDFTSGCIAILLFIYIQTCLCSRYKFIEH